MPGGVQSSRTTRLSVQKSELALLALGLLAWLPYFYALYLNNLRLHTRGYLIAFGISFIFYSMAVVLALRLKTLTMIALVGAFVIQILMLAVLTFTSPTLSDDMYRYIWDGRVQARGISPYLYPPDAVELRSLRDRKIWPMINRKSAPTVYPPAAEMIFALLWRIKPDSIRWYQLVMAGGGLLAGVGLVKLLKVMGLSSARVVIYLWSPLLVYETAHAAHLEGLVLPLLVAAFWARWQKKDGWLGFFLGIAAGIKLYPVLLFPALWRGYRVKNAWQMPVVFTLTLVMIYLPYVITSGAGVIGFLPQYIREFFNIPPLVRGLQYVFIGLGVAPQISTQVLAMACLGGVSIYMLVQPAMDGWVALRRSAWLIGIYSMLTQNLFPWYMLWLLMLTAIFLGNPSSIDQKTEQPWTLRIFNKKPSWFSWSTRLPRLDAWLGWWFFCGAVNLSYSFFIAWKEVPLAIWLEYLPLYCILLLALPAWFRTRRPNPSFPQPRHTQLASQPDD